MRFDQLTIQAKLKQGKLVVDNKQYLDSILFQYDDCPLRMSIKSVRNSKTNRQLGYFFGGVLPPISDHTGHTIDDLYRKIFKPMFSPKEITTYQGKEIVSLKGISQMTVGEVVEFTNRVIAEASSMGIVIISPEEHLKNSL